MADKGYIESPWSGLFEGVGTSIANVIMAHAQKKSKEEENIMKGFMAAMERAKVTGDSTELTTIVPHIPARIATKIEQQTGFNLQPYRVPPSIPGEIPSLQARPKEPTGPTPQAAILPIPEVGGGTAHAAGPVTPPMPLPGGTTVPGTAMSPPPDGSTLATAPPGAMVNMPQSNLTVNPTTQATTPQGWKGAPVPLPTNLTELGIRGGFEGAKPPSEQVEMPINIGVRPAEQATVTARATAAETRSTEDHILGQFTAISNLPTEQQQAAIEKLRLGTSMTASNPDFPIEPIIQRFDFRSAEDMTALITARKTGDTATEQRIMATLTPRPQFDQDKHRLSASDAIALWPDIAKDELDYVIATGRSLNRNPTYSQIPQQVTNTAAAYSAEIPDIPVAQIAKALAYPERSESASILERVAATQRVQMLDERYRLQLKTLEASRAVAAATLDSTQMGHLNDQVQQLMIDWQWEVFGKAPLPGKKPFWPWFSETILRKRGVLDKPTPGLRRGGQTVLAPGPTTAPGATPTTKKDPYEAAFERK